MLTGDATNTIFIVFLARTHEAGATSGAGIDYPSGAPEVTPNFSGVRVTQSLVLCVCFEDRCLSFCSFFLAIMLSVLLRCTDSYYLFDIFCSSSMYGFLLPLWYLLFFLDVRIPITSLISSVLPRCRDSYYLFDIFCSSSMYGSLLPLWYLLFFLQVIGIPTSKKNRRYQRDNGNPYIEEEQKISKR
jgi:hypothetical protein